MERKEILGLPVNHEKLRRMFQQHVDNQADYARSLWTLLSLALWEEKHYRARHDVNDRPRLKSSMLGPGSLSKRQGLVADSAS